MKSFGNWLKPVDTFPCVGCGRIFADKASVITGPAISICRQCLDDAVDAMKGHGQEVVAVRASKRQLVRVRFAVSVALNEAASQRGRTERCAEIVCFCVTRCSPRRPLEGSPRRYLTNVAADGRRYVVGLYIVC
jgi:hypothetical protein